ncbi:MAG: hypothetical protein ACYTFV_11030 [Planctomycetota bacterium]|jgi:hypothetical protein
MESEVVLNPTPPSPPQEAAGGERALPTQAELLQAFGDGDLSLQALFRFAFFPAGRLQHLRELLPDEPWGENHFALLRYLAVHVRLAIEQARYEWNAQQLIVAAGRLSTADGLPIYLGFVPNSSAQQENPWVLNWVGERPSCAAPPEPAATGEWTPIDPGAEICVGVDLTANDGRCALGPLESVAPELRQPLVIGAVHWAVRRGLAERQLYHDARGHLVPLFLTQRADLSIPPDLVAPVTTHGERLLVRAVIEPQTAYPSARAAVDRWESLPDWLAVAWEDAVSERERTESSS